jgi:hypothetical protein
MNRRMAAHMVADDTLKKAVLPEIEKAGGRIERIVEQMMAGENPEINPQRLEEMADLAAEVQAYASKLK